MKDNTKKRAAYTAPTLTDFGKVANVTAAVGATFRTDAEFTGSMEFPGMVN